MRGERSLEKSDTGEGETKAKGCVGRGDRKRYKCKEEKPHAGPRGMWTTKRERIARLG